MPDWFLTAKMPSSAENADNGIFAQSIVLLFLSIYIISPLREETNMQRKFIKAVGCIITAAMAITLIVVFCFQTFVAYQNAEKDLDSLLNNTENLLLENNKTIEQLKESTADEYLIRARAFAVMIDR